MKKLIVGAVFLAAAGPAVAGLNPFQTFVGNYGLSTDGGGSNDGDYTVSAFVPLGAVVTAAYLYQATNNSAAVEPITLNGSAVTFGPRVGNGTACCSLASARADVTSLIGGVVNGGAGGTYDFTIGEGNTGSTDGTALVVVYSLASLAESTVAILDGWASVSGDTTNINFSEALNPAAPGFTADIRLGIGFSCCGSQRSTINVNGDLMTENAGNNDDGLGSLSNGQLITVGGNDDPFSGALPSYADDHERYDLTSFITAGDTKIRLDTFNSSADDNIFLLAGLFSGRAGINQPPPGVPEPATWMMLISGFALAGAAMRRRKVAVSFS
jgi:hypothetical protein